MKEINDKITLDKVMHYLNLTKAARQKATAIHEPKSQQGQMLTIVLRMADDYANDDTNDDADDDDDDGRWNLYPINAQESRTLSWRG